MTTDGGHDDQVTRHLRHDVAGEAYTASADRTATGRSRPAEDVSSRSTEEEAQDLLSLRRAKRGDDAAFADLVSNNDEAVRGLLAALLGRTDLDRLCTQVYLRSYRGLSVAPSTRPRIWLLSIADGVARDAIRRTATGASGRGRHLDPPIPLDRPADQRLVLAAVEGVGLTPREAARLIPGGLDEVRRYLQDGREDPEISLPLPQAPAHDRGFWGDLGRHLLIERSAPAIAGTPRVRRSSTGTGEHQTPARSVETGRVARGMAERMAQQHPRTIPWHRILVAGAVVATLLVVVAVAFTVVNHATTRDAGLGETATKVLNKLDAALANDAVIRGAISITSNRPRTLPSGRYRFARSNTGSWNLRTDDASHAEGYDVASATFATVRQRADQPVQATLRTGVAPGPPETTAVSDDAIGDLLADAVRLVRSGSGGSATTRPVPTSARQTTTTPDQQWVVTSELEDPGKRNHPVLAGTGALSRLDVDQATLIADQSYALPVKLELSREGRPVATIRFTDLSISQQAPTSSFAPAIPEGVEPARSDVGFTPIELGEVTAEGGSSIPTPSYLPAGFVLTATARNTSSSSTVLCYRNGSRQLVITLRPKPDGANALTDPFTRSTSEPPKSEDVDISSGVFAGRTGRAADEPIDHVRVNGPTTQVIAAGDPAIDQLIKVVSSLR